MKWTPPYETKFVLINDEASFPKKVVVRKKDGERVTYLREEEE